MISLPPSLPGPMFLGHEEELKRFADTLPRLDDLPVIAQPSGIPLVVAAHVPDDEVWLYMGFRKGVVKFKLEKKPGT